jgi:hypothetical protein
MMDFDWKKTLPFIGALATGGVPALVMAAAGALTDALGTPVDPTQAGIDTAMKNATPEQLAKLKQIDADLKTKMREFDVQEKQIDATTDQAYLKDRDSSRNMQVATHSNTPTVLTYLITSGFFGILGWMLYDSSVVNSPPLLIMLGTLGTAWTACVSFWVGTTNSSQRKDTLLANSTPLK